MNTIYLGDCLNVLRESVPDESVDLVYIDPPFNSKRDYNIFFDDKEIQTQRIAFEDTWTLKNITDSLAELHTLKTDNLYYLLLTYQKVAPHAFPYLTMMSLRILELHRVLKPTGSFYLHCDPTMSHYLKTICDIIFNSKNFLNEILWKRFNFHADAKRFGTISDRILFYARSEEFIFNKQVKEYDEAYIESKFTFYDENDRRFRLDNLNPPGGRGPIYEFCGVKKPWRFTEEKMKDLDKSGYIYKKSKIPQLKRYFDELQGQAVPDIWDDISPINSQAKERLGYPTQKPKALLERIIKASSNEGDTVLDGFCGCGTTVDAAESLHRNWIGIDISPIAISLIKRRLIDTYGEHLNKFEVRGTPTDEQSAIALWQQNPNAFQDWWLTEFEVFSTTFGTKGADKGVDGLAQYLTTPHSPPFTKGGKQKGGSTFTAEEGVIRAAFSVKGGVNIQSKDIDALLGAMDKHKCELGVFLTIAEPTKPMLDTIAGAGFVEIPGFNIPRLQILTLKEYFGTKKLKLPSVNITFKAAQLKGKNKQNQIKLEM
jgi:site-specific DNA-methyltransferase (adenine-specific)